MVGATATLLIAARAAGAPSPDVLRTVPPGGGTTRPFVSIAAERVFDATSGDPVTALEVGQTARVVVGLLNIGAAEARIRAHLSGTGVNISGADADYGSVPAGASADASYLVTPASCPAPAPSLAVRSGSAVTTVAVPLPVACARLPLEVVAATWDDRARGNADGMPEAGETARVTLQLKNIGDAVMRDVGGTLDPRDAVVRGAASFGDISPGATATSVSSLLVTMKRGAPSVPGECSGRFMVNGVDLDSHATVVRLGGVQGIVQLLGTFHARADNRRTDVPVRNSLTCAQDAAFRLPTPAPAGPLKLQLVAMLAAFVALGVALRRRRMIAAFIRTRAIPSIARRRSR